MRKCILFLILSLSISFLRAQEIKKIDINDSDSLHRISEKVNRIWRPVFYQQGTTLTADSADFNTELNTFDAFGHIVISQPDGTVIYSDLLNYNGNTREAILTKNVKMIDKEGSVLTTNLFTYNMGTRIGRYVEGGKIVNKGDILTSKNASYFSSTKDAYFKYDVVIATKDALVKADTMRYNSGTRDTYFYGPTHIYSKADTFFTELGTYNTESRLAYGYKNNLYQQGSKFLKGDTLFYDDVKGFGRANRNVVFTDNGSQKIMLFGQLGTYNRVDTSAMLTVRPYMIFLTQDSSKVDSIIMAADTLYTKLIEKRRFKAIRLQSLSNDPEAVNPDEEEVTAAPRRPALRAAKPVQVEVPEKKLSRKQRKEEEKKQKELKKSGVNTDSIKRAELLKEELPGDSLKKTVTKIRPKTAAQLVDSIQQDSIRRDSVKLSLDTTKTRIVLAYRNVKIYKSDLQSKSDSVFYSYSDSIIRSYGNPMVWAQGSQLSSDTLYMQMKDKKLNRMLLQRNGFIVNAEGDSVLFNQVKGRIITGFFRENKLQRMYVDGNAESIYFSVDSSDVMMNRTKGSRLRITFKNSALEDIVGIRQTNGILMNNKQVENSKRKLEGFLWKPKERPKSKEEIIPKEVEKKTLTPEKKAVPVKKTTPIKKIPKPVKKK